MTARKPQTAEDAKAQETERQVNAAKRLMRLKTARERLIDYTAMSMPDPSDPDDPEASRYQIKPHHELICNELEAVERGETTRLIVNIGPRHGKALALDTPIPTPDGWRVIGDLQPGDTVFDDTGRPTSVVAKSSVFRSRPVYEVTTDDGFTVLADAEHEWLARPFHKRPAPGVWTTASLAEAYAVTGRRALIHRQGPLDTPDADVSIRPYVLGVWLGDGCSDHATVTEGAQDIEAIRQQIEAEGYTTSERTTDNTFGVLGLNTQLRSAGLLGNKHIPSAYLRGSYRQRLELLQGLVDTDGYVPDSGQIEVTFTDADIAEAAQELVLSLGRKAALNEDRARLNGRDCGPRYRLNFYMAGAARLPRRASRCRDVTVRPHRYVSAVPAGEADTVCIQVDSPSSMFLAGRGMLPTHNSEIISKRFPTWFMGRDPYRQTIVSSYADDLATEFGREARDIMNQSFYQQVFPGVELRKGSQAADRLQTTRGGLMVYRGVGSALTGYGADLAIVDDPIKDRASANSRTIRDTQWHWFTQVLMTRLMGAMGRVVIVMTRWHDDDVIGRLTDPENPHYDPIEASKWRVLNLPAIAETDDILGREEGEILWPERIPREFLEGQRRLDPAGFNALYQGRPAPPEGNFFKKEHLRTYKAHDLPRDLRYYAASDHAVSMQQDRDRTVAGCVGVDADDNIYIMPDVVWRQMDAETATEVMMDQMRRYNPLFWWAEKGHISQSIGPFLRKRMLEENTYINIDEKTPVKDKQTRAQAIQARIAMGKVFLPDFAPWYAAAVDELLNFPFGNHDDFVDWLAWIGIGLSQQTPARRSMSKEKEVPETGSARWITESSKWHSQLRDSASRYFN